MEVIYRYPPEVHEFVKKWSPKMRDEDLAEACNKELGTSFTAKSMKSFRGNHGYRNGQKQWTREEYLKYQKHYPQGMYEFVRDNSWGVPSKDMAEMVNEKFGTNYTPTMMKQYRQRFGIKSGVTGWFRKGRPPANKGHKMTEYASPEALERCKRTQFKKGDRPKNELPVGTVVINTDGYKLRKRQMEGNTWERWEFLHRAVWEEHYGPVPEGMIVSFKDSNKLNCSIDNLMLITRGENSALTAKHYRFQDPELTETALNTIRLKNAAKERKKAAAEDSRCHAETG